MDRRSRDAALFAVIVVVIASFFVGLVFLLVRAESSVPAGAGTLVTCPAQQLTGTGAKGAYAIDHVHLAHGVTTCGGQYLRGAGIAGGTYLKFVATEKGSSDLVLSAPLTGPVSSFTLGRLQVQSATGPIATHGYYFVPYVCVGCYSGAAGGYSDGYPDDGGYSDGGGDDGGGDGGGFSGGDGGD